jgi:hypothetical protein
MIPNADMMLPGDVALIVGWHLIGKVGAVVELGSGHGSARIAEHLPSGLVFYSVEHDRRFIGLVAQTTYIYAPIVDGWYARADLNQLPERDTIQALIVDGPPGEIGRAGLLRHLDLFPARVPMIIDDVHRPDELALAREIGRRRNQEPKIHHCADRAFAVIGWD